MQAEANRSGPMNPETLNVGDRVVFIEPMADELDAEGRQVVMVVKEISGGRALVEDQIGQPVNPTRRVMANELRKV
jgi:hypothetical protein